MARLRRSTQIFYRLQENWSTWARSAGRGSVRALSTFSPAPLTQRSSFKRPDKKKPYHDSYRLRVAGVLFPSLQKRDAPLEQSETLPTKTLSGRQRQFCSLRQSCTAVFHRSNRKLRLCSFSSGALHSTRVSGLRRGNLEFMSCGYTSLPRVRVVNRGHGPWLRDAIDFASWLQLPRRISESWAFRMLLSCRGGVADAGLVGAVRQGLSFQNPGCSARVSHPIAARYLGFRSPKRETDRGSGI